MANYFVKTAAAGGNDGNSGLDWANAWATVQHAADTAIAGDTVTFASDTWDIPAQIDFDTNSGSSGNLITFQADVSRAAIWERDCNGGAVVYVDQDYITFDGILIDGDSSGGRTGHQGFGLETTSHITITDCEIRDLQGHGIGTVSGSADLLIEDTDIDLNFYGAGNTYDGIHILNEPGNHDNSNLTIKNTTIQRTDHTGISIERASNFVVEYCTIHDTHSHGIGLGDPEEVAGAGVTTGTIQYCTIYNVEQFHPEAQDHDGIIMMHPDVGAVTIQKNDIYVIDSDGIHIRADITGPIKIYNNTIYDYNQELGDDATAGFFFWAPAAESPVVEFKNNIIYSTFNGCRTLSVLAVSLEANLDMDYNLYYADFANGQEIRRGGVTYATYAAYLAAGYEPNSVLGSDPDFTNAAGGDFTLLVTSPAIDQGTNVGLPFFGTAPDIGAHEYQPVGDTVVYVVIVIVQAENVIVEEECRHLI